MDVTRPISAFIVLSLYALFLYVPGPARGWPVRCFPAGHMGRRLQEPMQLLANHLKSPPLFQGRERRAATDFPRRGNEYHCKRPNSPATDTMPAQFRPAWIYHTAWRLGLAPGREPRRQEPRSQEPRSQEPRRPSRSSSSRTRASARSARSRSALRSLSVRSARSRSLSKLAMGAFVAGS